MILDDFINECNPFVFDLNLGQSGLEKNFSMRVSDGYSFDTLFCKFKYFSFKVEALLMHIPAVVDIIHARLNSDIYFESFTKNMRNDH